MDHPQRRLLPDDELQAALTSLKGWSVQDRKLHREYKFSDFTTAIGFIAASATVIEKLDHHPEWFNVYGTVRIDLWTHSSGGITPMDVLLAGKLESIATRLL